MGVSPQYRQDELQAKNLLKTGDGRRTLLKSWKLFNEQDQGGSNQKDPMPDPAQSPDKLDILSEFVCRFFLTWRVSNYVQDDLNLKQGPGQACRQAVRQQSKGGVSFPAVPSGYLCPCRKFPGVGPVSGQGASPSGVQGAGTEFSKSPGFLPDVFFG